MSKRGRENGIMDRGFEIEKSEPRDGSMRIEADNKLIPLSSIHNPDVLKRMRWRCRRGLLELDIFLQPFVALHYASLSDAEILAFDELLDMPDNTLWDMMTGRQQTDNQAQQALLDKIKSV